MPRAHIPHARVASKVRGGRDGGSSSGLVSSHSTQFPDFTSPLLTKSGCRQLLSEIGRFLDLRVPRRPRTFAKIARKRTTPKVSYHAPLYDYAFSRIKSTSHHHSHALRRHHACQGQVTRASKLKVSPLHSATTIAGPSRVHPPYLGKVLLIGSARLWAVGRYRHVGHTAGGVCGLGRPSAAPSQVNGRSWERHFQRRDAK